MGTIPTARNFEHTLILYEQTAHIPIILIKSVLFSMLVFILRVSVSLCVVIGKDIVCEILI